jgi:hypothetical protein
MKIWDMALIRHHQSPKNTRTEPCFEVFLTAREAKVKKEFSLALALLEE